MRTVDTAHADQNIADQAGFMGTWLDEQTLRDEFDAIIAAAWPTKQTINTRERILCDHARLMAHPAAHHRDEGAVYHLANQQGRCGGDQHGRERAPPPINP